MRSCWNRNECVGCGYADGEHFHFATSYRVGSPIALAGISEEQSCQESM